MNTGLKLVDLKRTTRPFLFSMDHGANILREEMHRPRLMFMHDSVFLQAVHANEDLETLQRRPSFSNRKRVMKRNNSSVGASSAKKKMSRTPDQPLQRSIHQSNQQQMAYQDVMQLMNEDSYQLNNINPRVEVLGLDDSQCEPKININTNSLFQ